MEDFRVKKWITNCMRKDAFERLVAVCAADPDGFYEIGPPRETKSFYRDPEFLFLDDTRLKIPLRGYTSGDLEKMDMCGIYEVFPREPPVRPDI